MVKVLENQIQQIFYDKYDVFDRWMSTRNSASSCIPTGLIRFVTWANKFNHIQEILSSYPIKEISAEKAQLHYRYSIYL